MSNSELTKKERKWISDVQKVLNKCPSKRLEFYTIGDRNVFIFDNTKIADVYSELDKNGGEFGSCCERVGASFDIDLFFPNAVHSTAG